MRCKDCEYFNLYKKEAVDEYGNEKEGRWGNCSNDEIFQDASDFIFVKPTEKTLFRYADIEQYGASFQVHENFGCVGFKKREEER